jgi:glycosyltransferase involved in cell wall biosynthesis
MKIAHLVPHWSPYTVHRLVGIKKLINLLFTEQLKRGHDVYIVATEDSDAENKRILRTIPSLKEYDISVYNPRSLYYGLVHASLAAQYGHRFDIVHSHLDHIFLPFIPLVKTPVVSTIHGGNYMDDEVFIFKKYYGQFNAVGISKSSIKVHDYIKFDYQVYNGMDISEYRLEPDINQGNMFFLGRINESKGVIEAINIANLTKRKLIIAGFKEADKEDYYNKVVEESRKSPVVDFINNTVLEDKMKVPLYSSAKLFLFPLQWEEPFGLVMIEAMTTGTPVVAFARGSVPEIIKDGETGFIVNPSNSDIRGGWIIKKTGIAGLCEAVEKIYSMPQDQYKKMRQNCRQHVEDNFTVEKMVDGYERIYRQIVEEDML